MISRRGMLGATGAGALLTALSGATVRTAARAATRLSGASYQGKYTRALKRPPQVNLTGSRRAVTIDVTQFTQQVLTGFPATRLWGYGVAGAQPTWPGPTLRATAGKTVTVTWRNRLPKGSRRIRDAGGHLLPLGGIPLDDTISDLPAGEKPIVPHLHGAHVDWRSDGHPSAWFTQSGRRGARFSGTTYTYDNSQRAGSLWYHDHTDTLTRVNVGAGMAGAYVLGDDVERSLVTRNVLPQRAFEYELILQDRQFDDDGQLVLPTTDDQGNSPPLAFFGDFITVNGIPWPKLDVEPRKYRFRLVNGSDTRFYLLHLSTEKSFLVIGTDLGLLNRPVAVKRLQIAPGERYEIVVDFSKLERGTAVTLLNDHLSSPFLGFRRGDTITNKPSDRPFGFDDEIVADPRSTGQVMRFDVSKPLSGAANGSVTTKSTLGAPMPVRRPTKTRKVMAFLGATADGRPMEMLGTVEQGTAMWMDAATETIRKGTTEIWEFYNTGPLAHPIHLHLVNFEVLDRAPFDYETTPTQMMDGMVGGRIQVTSVGQRRAPEPYERGPKDTVVCYPDEVTRLVATFDRAGNYVWHCHILHHEDHDMMRPITIT